MSEPKYLTLERAKRRAKQLLVFLEAEDDEEEEMTPFQVASLIRIVDDLIDYNWLYWMCKNLLGETEDDVVDRLQESEDLVKGYLSDA